MSAFIVHRVRLSPDRKPARGLLMPLTAPNHARMVHRVRLSCTHTLQSEQAISRQSNEISGAVLLYIACILVSIANRALNRIVIHLPRHFLMNLTHHTEVWNIIDKILSDSDRLGYRSAEEVTVKFEPLLEGMDYVYKCYTFYQHENRSGCLCSHDCMGGCPFECMNDALPRMLPMCHRKGLIRNTCNGAKCDLHCKR